MIRRQPASVRQSARATRLGPLWLALLLGVGLALSALAAELTFPTLSGRIVDGAGIISPDARARIEAKLSALEAKTSDQVVIATVRSLQDTSVEDFANRLYRHWALGQKDKNNGVLVLVAPNERKVRIEVGSGLEGQLTDPEAKKIIDTTMIPAFAERRYAEGIEAGVVAIAAEIGGTPLSKAQK